jgi:hypothetical protein
MSVRRYLFLALVTKSLIQAGACLVFDGKVATELDASATDASGDASADGRDATQGGDARDGTVDHRRDDAPADQFAQDADGDMDTGDGDAGGVDGVECNGSVCTGGLKCCARGGGDSSSWVFLKTPCQLTCSDGGGGGYYDYKCNDSEDCDAGVCCAYRNMGAAPPFTTSRCQAKCLAPAKELCQKKPSAGCKIGTCVTGDRHYLPPGFDECN